LLRNPNVGFAYSDYLYFGNKLIYRQLGRFDLLRTYKILYFIPVTRLYRSELVKDKKFNRDLPVAEDYDFTLEVIRTGARGKKMKSSFLCYRISNYPSRDQSLPADSPEKAKIDMRLYQKYPHIKNYPNVLLRLRLIIIRRWFKSVHFFCKFYDRGVLYQDIDPLSNQSVKEKIIRESSEHAMLLGEQK
jgi:hypothetical protein